MLRTLSSLLMIGLSLATISFGAVGLIQETSSEPMYELAVRVEKTGLESVSHFQPNQLLNAIPVTSDSGKCLTSKHERARITVTLASYDVMVIQAADVDQRISEAAQIEHHNRVLDQLAETVRCRPTDGNTWLRFALVQNLKSGPTQVVLDAFQRSYWYAPAEKWILDVRQTWVEALLAVDPDNLILQEIYKADQNTLTTISLVKPLD